MRVVSARAVPGFQADGIVPAPGPLRNVAGIPRADARSGSGPDFEPGEWTDDWSWIRLRSDLQEFLPDDRGANLLRGLAVSCHFICQQNLLKARSAACSVLGSITIKQASVPDAVATAVARLLDEHFGDSLCSRVSAFAVSSANRLGESVFGRKELRTGGVWVLPRWRTTNADAQESKGDCCRRRISPPSRYEPHVDCARKRAANLSTGDFGGRRIERVGN